MFRRVLDDQLEGWAHDRVDQMAAAGAGVTSTHHHVRVRLGPADVARDVAFERKELELTVEPGPLVPFPIQSSRRA